MDKLQIANLAEELAKKYNPDGLSPFPYEEIEKDKKDLHIFYSEQLSENLSGAIIFDKDDNDFSVIINKNKPETRKNFTIAHELGHYFLHLEIIKEQEIFIDGENSLDSNNILFRLDNAKSSQLEIEANNFAASLLMPADLVTKAWETLKSVEECAKIFNVSVSAMSIRLERMGLLK